MRQPITLLIFYSVSALLLKDNPKNPVAYQSEISAARQEWYGPHGQQEKYTGDRIVLKDYGKASGAGMVAGKTVAVPALNNFTIVHSACHGNGYD
jgi:hypothetical protein